MVEVDLFLIFVRVALVSFGGVVGLLPEIERQVVLQHHWMTSEEFYKLYVVAQVLPGPNMVMCPMIGFRVAGWTGMIAGFIGIYLVPSVLMISAAWAYKLVQDHPIVQAIQGSLQPTIIGLICASVFRLWWVQIASNKEFAFAALGSLCALFVTFASRRFRVSTLPIMVSGSFLWLLLRHIAGDGGPVR